MTDEELQRGLERLDEQRREQGFPDQIEDPEGLAAIRRIFAEAARNKRLFENPN